MSLKNRGIQVLRDSRVREITQNAVLLADGTAIEADLKVWAAGIKAPEFLSRLDGLAVNRLNQLNVHRNLSTTLDAEILRWEIAPAARKPGAAPCRRAPRLLINRPHCWSETSSTAFMAGPWQTIPIKSMVP